MNDRRKTLDSRCAAALVAALAFGLADCGASEPAGAASTSVAPSASTPAATAPRVITDIAHWQHPAKSVFAKYGITLQKVTIADKRPVFEVQFPFDPQTGPNARKMDLLCAALLKANGQWPYALVSPDDDVEFDVMLDRRSGRIEITNHPLDTGAHPG